ncbi:uncharacterized protein LOC116615488 [Nematostella vectensis]|uniref:uncharacterized protein LOC116615488 n=1 Tax=Nematostella vectensis TaxID=45351 RepID=UPI002076D820|nr:uncharacterized protein LOC116615488 [Nematostella vectensis]
MMAASVSFTSGLNVTSQAFLAPGSLVQGGDSFRYVMSLTYSGALGNFAFNSSLCNSLPTPSQLVQGLVTLPLALSLLSVTTKNQNITSNISSCNSTPVLNISTVILGGTSSLCRISINGSNVGWTTKLEFLARVTERVEVESILNITGDLTMNGESKSILIASYKAYSVGNPSFAPIHPSSTNIAETPSTKLTSGEVLTFRVNVQIPSVTINMALYVSIPSLTHSPLGFAQAQVYSIPFGMTIQNLRSGSPSTFPQSNVAEFAFGETVNTIPLANTSDIAVSVSVRLTSLYEPVKEANISCWLTYQTPSGTRRSENVNLLIQLTQPLLEFSLDVLNKKPSYQGGDILVLETKVKNPGHATMAASNVTITASVPSVYVDIKNSSYYLCNPECVLINNAFQLNVSVSSLNASCEILARLTLQYKTIVVPGSYLPNTIQLKYYHTDWQPVKRSLEAPIYIKPLLFIGPVVSNTSVASPSDNTVVTPSEKITFTGRVEIPVSTSHSFLLVIRSNVLDVISASILSVGADIETDNATRLQPGLELNITSDNIPGLLLTPTKLCGYGRFRNVKNTGQTGIPGNNQFVFKATVRASNASALEGVINAVGITEVFVNNDPNSQRGDFSFQVVRPELSLTGEASPSLRVEANQDVEFTFILQHTPVSKAHAYRVLVELAVPNQYLTLDPASVSPGSVQVVNGDQAKSGDSRYNSAQTKVLVYEKDEFLHDASPLVIRYKARTTSGIPSSIYVASPSYLSYTVLPAHMAPLTGGTYVLREDKASFLTIRPERYVEFINTPDTSLLDAGDRVEYNITVTNTGSQGSSYTAYNFEVTFQFDRLIGPLLTCSRGTVMPSGSSVVLQIGDLLDKESFGCNITGFVDDQVVPKEDISPVINYRYFSRPSSSPPPGVAAYAFASHASVLVTPISANITGSENINTLMAGETFGLSIHLAIPECSTSLRVRITTPVIDFNGTRFDRQRQDVEVSGPVARHLRARRSSSKLIYVLEPLLNGSAITLDVNNTMTITNPSPNITRIDTNTLEVDFGSVQHAATASPSTQGLTVYLRFQTAGRPMELSGRRMPVTVHILLNGTSQTAAGYFTIVGPLFKPLLSVKKTVQPVDVDRDSPLLMYNVTVTHAPGSRYDAYDVDVRDMTKNMELVRASVRPVSGVMVTYPETYTYYVTLTVPRLAIGESVMLQYQASFLIKQKSLKELNLPATVFWKSIQLNSPRYALNSNLTACVARVDASRFKTSEITGYFALGILLGLVIGLVVAMVIIYLIVKCCDKGRIAPWYTRFTKKKSMTVLTGGSQYIFHGGGDGDGLETKLVARHNETSIINMDESIIPILSLDNSTQTEKELDSLDVQATVTMDADLEVQRQNMLLQVMGLLAKKLRVKRDISTSQEKNFIAKLKSEIAGVSQRLGADFKRRSAEVRRKIQRMLKAAHADMVRRQAKEIKETEAKIKGLVSQRERRDIIDVLRRRHAKEEEDLRKKFKLEEDVEMERLRKEVAVNKRFTMKEAQSKLLQDLIKEAEFNEDQASALVKEHLGNMAAVDKAMDEEKSRRVVALEMRLAERRALAIQKHDESDFNKRLVQSLEEQHENTMQSLVSSSKISEAEANAYIERYKKEVDALKEKTEKEKRKQQDTLHKRLTALKQKRIDDKNREHQEELRKLNEEQNDKYEQVEIDCIVALNERRKILERQRQEREELEQKADREAAEELEKFDEVYSHEIHEQAKTSLKKIYQDMAAKGLDEAEKNAIIDRYMTEATQQQEKREEERQKNADRVQKRLGKLRRKLEEKAILENEEQTKLRKKEEQIVTDLIVNQANMSEQERNKIIEEHEKHLAELETSMTFNKLRQRQMLEERLAARRKRRMDELERDQHAEEQTRDDNDKILDEGEDVELLKKHELEKMSVTRDESDSLEEEMEMVRDEMLRERTKQLEEHQENLSATIARLQIEKAKQIAQMSMQQQLLGQLQTNLVDEMEEHGAFEDPETKSIVDKYKKDTKKMEEALNNQRTKQEEALRERLQKKMKEREEKFINAQKDVVSQYTDNNKTATRFRRAAAKARQQKEMQELRERMEREIEQSLNELRMANEFERMKALENQNIKFISGLVNKGKMKEEEIESVLKFLFPSKSSEYIEEMMVKIFPSHVRSNSSFSRGDIGDFEKRVRRNSVQPIPYITSLKTSKKKKKRERRAEEEDWRIRPEDQDAPLPQVVVRGGKLPRGRADSLPPLDRGAPAHREDRELDHADESSGTSLPFSRRSPQAFSPVSDREDQRLLNEMFGDSTEGEDTRPERRKKKKRKDR